MRLPRAYGRSSDWWRFGPANELNPAAIALLLRGSTFTLYGGSVFTSWIDVPRSRSSTSAGSLESPYSSRWSPRTHKSPDCVIA